MTENNTTQQTAPAENTAEITEALRAEYAELTDKIRAARRAYYNEDAPFLSDAEYDKLYRRLEIIEAEHPLIIANDSPTQEVGGEAIEAFAPVTHLQRMYSPRGRLLLRRAARLADQDRRERPEPHR